MYIEKYVSANAADGFFEDKKLEEIAEILQENVNTVKSRLYRGVKKLRLEMED